MIKSCDMPQSGNESLRVHCVFFAYSLRTHCMSITCLLRVYCGSIKGFKSIYSEYLSTVVVVL